MKELVILSGKGGTGKTSITAALLSLAAAETTVTLADTDVDAADLFLIADPVHETEEIFFSGTEARFDSSACRACGACLAACRFDAIRLDPGGHARAAAGCEGCGVCALLCPSAAIELVPRRCGLFWKSRTRFGTMFHARLDPAGENSGKLVTKVRTEARQHALATAAAWLLVDGPPGIGCPAIASITGADAILAVAEPGITSLHDLERLFGLTRHFSVPTFVVVNKWDINPEMTATIEAFARAAGVTPAGRIPWSRAFVDSQLAGQAITEMPAHENLNATIMKIWRTLCKNMEQ